MLVREVLEIATDDEQMQGSLVHRFKATNRRARMRIADPEMESCVLPRSNQVWSDIELQEVRLVIAGRRHDERHSTPGTFVTRATADVPVHRTPKCLRASRRTRSLL